MIGFNGWSTGGLVEEIGGVMAHVTLIHGIANKPSAEVLLDQWRVALLDLQKKLAPPWSRHDGWPTIRLGTGPWTNVADRLDPVCGFDAAIGGGSP